MTVPDHKAALGALLGEDCVLALSGDTAAYATGARYDQGRAALVLRPRETAAVSKALAYCVTHGLHVIPQSGNTGLVSGSTPDDTGTQVVLSLDRLDKGFRLDAANRSVRVDAGMRLSDLNGRLQAHGLFFPIDLGADPRIGGMLATNTGGSRFLRYGDVRRNTLGLTVVLADEKGTVLKLGSGLRKNNVGVDWKQLFVGTSGAFGVITQAELNLEPLPQQTATAYLVPRDGDAVISLLATMENLLGSYLSAFEGMSCEAVEAAIGHIPSLRNPFANGVVPPYVILAEVSRVWAPREGEQSLDAVLEEALTTVWEMEDAPLSDAFVGSPTEMWALRHALSEGVKHRGRLIAFDLAFRRGDIMSFCKQMRQEVTKRFPEVTVCDFGHVGDGGVHLNLVVPPDSESARTPEFENRLREWVFDVAVGEFGGSFSAEHGIGRKNQRFYDRYTEGTVQKLNGDLKLVLSPGELGAMRF